MKILFTIPTLMHGGAERVVTNLANHLATHDHDIEVLLFYDKPVWYKLDPKVRVVIDEQYIGDANIIKHVFWRHKYFRKTNADVVISFLAPNNMVNIVAKLGLKVPLIVADRSDPRKTPGNFFFRSIRNILYRLADGVVLQNKRNQDYFSDPVKRKSRVIYNPVDVGEFKGAALDCKNKKKEIAYVGRLIAKKNPLMLLEAFALVSNEFPEYSLVFYGDGDMKEVIQKRVLELSLSDRVYLPGAVHDVFEKISVTALYVMTSDYEGMPNALIEAMCVGLPVISTKVSGATDLIQDEENGRLVDCGNSYQLADSIRAMLNNPDKMYLMAKNATLLADQITIDKISAKWVEYAMEVCKLSN